VLAETCSRIYYRNAINNGYPVLFVKGISDAIKHGDISDGDVLDVNMDSGEIINTANGKTFHGDAVSNLEHDIMEAGGLFQYMKKTAKE
jgi:isopropylmalate/citramalate isomerase small subunit